MEDWKDKLKDGWKWSDYTLGGHKIIFAMEDGGSGWVGIAKSEKDGSLCGCTWCSDGTEDREARTDSLNLVPKEEGK